MRGVNWLQESRRGVTCGGHRTGVSGGTRGAGMGTREVGGVGVSPPWARLDGVVGTTGALGTVVALGR